MTWLDIHGFEVFHALFEVREAVELASSFTVPNHNPMISPSRHTGMMIIETSAIKDVN